MVVDVDEEVVDSVLYVEQVEQEEQVDEEDEEEVD